MHQDARFCEGWHPKTKTTLIKQPKRGINYTGIERYWKKRCFLTPWSNFSPLLRVGGCKCVVRTFKSENQLQYQAFQRLGTISISHLIDFLLGVVVGVQWQYKWHLLLYFVSFWHLRRVLRGQYGPFRSGKVTRKMTANIQTQQCPTKSYHYGDMEYLANVRKLVLV